MIEQIGNITIRSDKKRSFLFLLLFSMWALWLSVPYFARGPLSYVRVHVNADSYVSRLYWLNSHAEQGLSSILEPAMCTTDRIVDYGMPSLFELLGEFLPAQVVYVFLMFIQRFAAVAGTFLLLRNIFKLSSMVSLLGGFAFSLGATRGEQIGSEWLYVHFLQESCLPLLLYLVCIIPLRGYFMVISAILVGLFTSLTSQVDIGPFFTLPCAFLFGLIAREDIHKPIDVLRYAAFILIILFAFILYQYPHIHAAILNLPDSSRSAMLLEHRTYKDGWSLIIYRFSKMVPHIILGLLWVFSRIKRSRVEWALISLLLFTTIFGSMARPFVGEFAKQLGFLSSFNFDRLFLYAPFFWICAASMGIAQFRYDKIKISLTIKEFYRKFNTSELICIVLMVVVLQLSYFSIKTQWYASLSLDREGENWHRLYENPELKQLAKELKGLPVRTVTVGAKDSSIGWQPVFNLAYGLETADGFKMIYPWRFHQFWQQVVSPAYQASENNLTRRFMDVDASRMFLFPPDKEMNEFEVNYNLDLLSLANVGYLISIKPIRDSRLRLRKQVYTEEMFQQWSNLSIKKKVEGIFKGDYIGKRLYIYENPNAMSRVFAVGETRRFKASDDLLRTLSKSSLNELSKRVLVVEGDLPIGQETELGGTATSLILKSYTLEAVKFNIECDGTVIAVITNTYSRFWKCTVDGREVKPFPVYNSFLGILISKGKHYVVLTYDPPYARFVKTIFSWL